MFFFVDLMKDGANKETIFQPLSPLGSTVIISIGGTIPKVKLCRQKKNLLAREINVQCTIHQEHQTKNQKLSQISLEYLDESI